MADSSIEWTDATWNPIAGCTIVSPGCTNCYAMRMANRLAAMGIAKYAGLTRRSGGRAIWTGGIKLDIGGLPTPLRWRQSKMIFVNSMSDLFHEDIPLEFIKKVWAIMSQAHWHTFQILTKRPDRLVSVCNDLPLLQNVWLGTSVENADYISRLETIRRVKASVRFVSFEPLIGPIGSADLTGIEWAIVGGEVRTTCTPDGAAMGLRDPVSVP